MNDDNRKQLALVTGGGSGLGLAFCRKLAAKGWWVVCADISLVSARETAVELGDCVLPHLLDVTNAAAWNKLLEDLRRQWPRLDLLVNNAGICAAGEIGVAPIEDFERVLDVNLRGTLLGCQTFVPWLKETAPGGHVVNISSIAGVLSPPSMGAYNISKAGVTALSETLYAELRPLGIGVSVVMPGFFASDLLTHGRFATPRHQRLAERYMRSAQITADDVVEHTLHAVHRRKLYVVLGRRARWLWRIKRLAGTTLLNAMGKTHDRTMKRPDTPIDP